MSRPSVTLLHGWGYTPQLWQALISLLPDFECHAPLLLAPCPTLEEWADILAAKLPDGGLLVGWSLGAMLAYCIATRHPVKAGGLLLLAGSPHMRSEPGWPNGLDSNVLEKFHAGFRLAPERTMRRFLALQLVGDMQPQRIKPLLETSLCNTTQHQTALELGLQILFGADLRERSLPEEIPLSLVHGRGDEVMPWAGSEWLHLRHPKSTLMILDEAGHAPLLATPALLAEQIKALHDAT